MSKTIGFLFLISLYLVVSCSLSHWEKPERDCGAITELGGCNRHGVCAVMLNTGAVIKSTNAVKGNYVCGNLKPYVLIEWKWWLL
jgi:hypothetical protein